MGYEHHIKWWTSQISEPFNSTIFPNQKQNSKCCLIRWVESPGNLGVIKRPAQVMFREQQKYDQRSMTRWWQLKYVLFSPVFGEDEPNLTSIFFRWVGSTTNQMIIYESLPRFFRSPTMNNNWEASSGSLEIVSGHQVLSHWINGIWKGAFGDDPSRVLEAKEDAISEVYRQVLATWLHQWSLGVDGVDLWFKGFESCKRFGKFPFYYIFFGKMVVVSYRRWGGGGSFRK